MSSKKSRYLSIKGWTIPFILGAIAISMVLIACGASAPAEETWQRQRRFRRHRFIPAVQRVRLGRFVPAGRHWLRLFQRQPRPNA